MAKKKSRIKCLLISSEEGMEFLQPIFKKITDNLGTEFQFDLCEQVSSRVAVQRNQNRNRDFQAEIISCDLVLVDVNYIYQSTFLELGIARAIGKPIVFVCNEDISNRVPSLIRQSYFLIYSDKDDLQQKAETFLTEFIQNPKKFTPGSLTEHNVNSQVVIDLEKLAPREFENLCFELLSKLGYRQLEWKIKDEFIDAVSTLHREEPDGFEYDEYWLIAFGNKYKSMELLDMASHDPEYFTHRLFRDIFETEMIDGPRNMSGRSDMPITLLFILKGNDKLVNRIKDLGKRDFKMRRRGVPSTIRIRWWDENDITSLLQNHLSLATKYFSPDALTRSGVRLSYEELYKEYADKNEELQKTNQLLVSERNRAEILERDAAWKLLSFTAAHRLGNPIDAIDSELSNLKSAIEMKKPEIIKEIVKSMEVPVEKAKSIVAQFRNLSIAHEIVPVTINSEKLTEILKHAAKQATDKKVNVHFTLKKLPDISIDVQKLSECFDELIRNSLHFIKGENQKISISTGLAKNTEIPNKIDRKREYIKITFTDNGCGVPHEKKTDIFKPFERSYIHGTGLGLAFCEIIIEKHGGTIREIGKPGEGAIFEIFLPIQSKALNN